MIESAGWIIVTSFQAPSFITKLVYIFNNMHHQFEVHMLTLIEPDQFFS